MPALPAQQTIGSWTQEVLIKVIRDILENQPTTHVQHLTAETLDVVRRLVLRDELIVTRDTNVRRIGRTGEPGFENAWVNYGPATAPAGYWKDALGVVHLQGLIKSGTVGSAAFTLSPGFRPDFQHVFSSVSNGVIGRVDVFADGTVVPVLPSSNVWVTLDGISFRPA